MENVFRAYDIRGVWKREITEGFAEEIGLSFGTILGNSGRVAVGRDPRHGGKELCRAISSGLNKAGVDVVDVGMVPTPTLNYYCLREGMSAGVMISASHNPPEYNGIRFRKGDGSGYPECIPEVKRIYKERVWKRADKKGTLQKSEVVDKYLRYVVGKTNLEKKLRIVVDPGNGAASGIGKRMFEMLGCSVESINDFPDGDFPGRSAYPNEKTLEGLQESVREVGADLGVAYDGDADRAVFVDERGRVRSAEEVGIVIAREILREKKGEVALNIDCSMSVEEEVERMGGRVKRIRVGDVFLADAVKKGAVFAMESSSHFVIPKYFIFDDGIATSAYLSEILSKREEGLSEIMSGIPKYPIIRRVIEVEDDVKFRIVEMVAERFKDQNPIRIDGVKIMYSYGWGLIRASNTQPLLRLSAEGRDKKSAERIMREIESAVGEARKEAEGGRTKSQEPD